MFAVEAMELPDMDMTPLPVSSSTMEYSESNDSNHALTNESTLPAPDRGFRAWSFVCHLVLAIELLSYKYNIARGSVLRGRPRLGISNSLWCLS